MNRVWTEEEDAIIEADSDARIPRPVTAAKLGRPVPATRTRALKLGKQIQPHITWTLEDAAALKAALTQEQPPPTDKELCCRFGRPMSSIRWKIDDLGLAGPRRYRRDLVLSPEDVRARTEAIRTRPHGTKTRDANLARATRREARQQRKAAETSALAARRAAREEKRLAAVATAEQKARDNAARLLALTAARIAKAAEIDARRSKLAAAQRQAAITKSKVPNVPNGTETPRTVANRKPATPTGTPNKEEVLARLRSAWSKVASEQSPRTADPEAAERHLLEILSQR